MLTPGSTKEYGAVYGPQERCSQALYQLLHAPHYKVVPVVVFDGGSMPCKAATDTERQRKRELSLNMAKEQLEQGNTAAAVDLFRKAVHITPSMAYQLIQLMHSWHI